MTLDSAPNTRVLIVDDDEVIRLTVTRALRGETLQVAQADCAAEGLRLAIDLQPDLIISDINLPDGNGFDLLEKLRHYPPTAAIPVILLTSLGDRSSYRRGMTLGADDYLPKPFTRQELLEAVQAQLAKAALIERNIAEAVDARVAVLRRDFSAALAGQPPTAAVKSPSSAASGRQVSVHQGVVLMARIHPFEALAERLTMAEISEVLTQYFVRATQRLQCYGARKFQYRGDMLLTFFDDVVYGVRAALELRIVTQTMRSVLQSSFGVRGLPGLAWISAVYQGSFELMPGEIESLSTFAGDLLNHTSALNTFASRRGWNVVLPESLLAALPTEIHIGEQQTCILPSSQTPMALVELRGMLGVAPKNPADSASLPRIHSQAIHDNAVATSQAVKQAYADNLESLHLAGTHNRAEGLHFKGYRIVRRIGAGGMSEVFLAEREQDAMRCVLKVLDLRTDPSERLLARFIQEYTLVSQIDHPNVVHIYDQGFAERHAYIAMEYMDDGDLRSLVKANLSVAQVLDLILQAARALEAIHAQGIVHRDLKPENLMLRSNGTLALADFGIAKTSITGNLTQHDHIVGTPYYISPEQATTGDVSGRSDLYSLGIIFYELLSGSKPYRGDSIAQILGLHIHAAVPQLRPPRPALQPLIDALMAKQASQRPASASALIEQLTLLQTELG